ncbi:MAG TPA: PAS domain-containing protein [Stellaceae bacterium]|nr:PAS domain-containing protein [Stellaceae bacterium]
MASAAQGQRDARPQSVPGPDSTLLELLPAAVYLCDADGVILRFNRKAALLWGRTPQPGDPAERYSGAPRLFWPDGRPLPHAEAPIAEVLRTGVPARDVEILIERPDGERRRVLANIEPIRAASGAIVGALNCFQDITALRETEQRIEAARNEEARRLRALLDALPVAVYTTDAAGRVTFYNQAATDLAGRRPELGQEWCVTWRLYHPNGAPMPHAECPMAIALKENRPIRGMEAVAERPDGTRVPIMPFPTPLRDASGALVGGVNMLVDLGAAKRAEAALRDSERRLRELNESLEQQAEERARQLAASRAQLQAFFDVSPDWLTLQRATLDGKFVYADLNPTCEAAYGLTRDQVIGRTVEEVLGPEAARLPLHHLRECLRTGEPQRYIAERTMAGRTRTIDVVFVPVPGRGENGERFIITTARDITERQELEAQLHQAQKMEVLGQLTGGVAHDFNNLLTAITGNLELLEGRVETDLKSAKLVHAAQRAAERGAKLTEQLLAFSRRQHLRPQPVDINAVVRGMSDLLQRTIGPNLSVNTALAADLWPALVDATQIEIALLNLVINARDAMPVGGSVLIETRNLESGVDPLPVEIAGHDCLMLAVRDTGTGMSEEVRARAIEPFFTTKEVGRGSGLGLSQVYGVARQSGGTLAIDSAPGRGTTVRLYLPRAVGLPANAAASARAGDKAEQRGHILVVDDDADVREIAVQMLRQAGYGVDEAENGHVALEMLARGESCDLILIDMIMPGLNGLDTVRHARMRRPGIRALFMTGYTDTAMHAELAASGPVIKKPFRLAELADAVEHALGGRGDGAANVVPLRQRR